jgi:2-oxoglutarate dehydrogenase complex dehydrogenase (E1) component-like enzyme
VKELSEGLFREVLDDPAQPKRLRSLVLCSGKVYYDLQKLRDRRKLDDVAIVRVEQFYPWPAQPMSRVAERYGGAKEIVWAQEETQNRGGWAFMAPRLAELFPGKPLRYAGRRASASPAVGSLHVHIQEQEELVRAALEGK